ncbi:type I 3-dehydroquinate dehydratase [Acidianus sp. RZ1]|uniref:type I 3-dehydroquinate dehydratase n=1 Tax=Acidianus sp. RZ1 TaxID=1540082 RepID=UPI001491D6EC|nr:type I 3-dehydroquinate dehydratase [Acidianus sp. RZ1]NON62340.1 type I 3-dehydroquinate dehydratase [Acidianus sp. RZ1]
MKPLVVASLPIRTRADFSKVDQINSDLVELRLDYMNEPYVDIDFIRGHLRKLLVTIRDKNEGGVNPISDELKRKILRSLDELGVLYDVEASFLKRNNVNYKGKVVSVHYFNTVPNFQEVKEILEKYSKDAFTVKVAITGKDNYREFLGKVSSFDNVTIVPMGVDPIERIAFSLLNSKLIYAHAGESTAPGQMDYCTVNRILSCIFNSK